MHRGDGPDGTTLDLRVSTLAMRAIGALAALTPPTRPAAVQERRLMCERRTPKFIDQLYDAVISPDETAMADILGSLRSGGVSDDRIVGTCVPAVARRLGDGWLADTASFSLVTSGCARLQGLLRRMDDRTVYANSDHAAVAPAALLIVTPEGTQHTLGAIVLATQLRRAGAQVCVQTDVNSGTLSRLVEEKRPDGVLISAALGDSLAVLGGLVKTVRKASAHSRILIGGSVLDCEADVLKQTGTDLISHNWQEALRFCTSTQSPTCKMVDMTYPHGGRPCRMATGLSS